MARPPAPATGTLAPLVAPDPEFLWDAHEHVYRARHAGDWLLLAVLGGIPAATGADIWWELGRASALGRAVCGALALVALLVARVVYLARIDRGAVLSREGVAAFHGLWRRQLAWDELARLLERARGPVGSLASHGRSVVAEATDGRRLRLPEEAVGDYARFRRDAYAAFAQWREHAGAPGADWGEPDSTPYVAEERARDVRGPRDVAVGAGLLGVYLVALVPRGTVLGVALVAAALALGALAAGARTRAQTYILDERGIEGHGRRRRARLDWAAITRVEWRRPPAWAALRRLHALIDRPGAWTDGTAWPSPPADVLVLGAAGRRLRLRVGAIGRPAPLLARIERSLRVAQQREAVTRRASVTAALDAQWFDFAPVHGPYSAGEPPDGGVQATTPTAADASAPADATPTEPGTLHRQQRADGDGGADASVREPTPGDMSDWE